MVERILINISSFEKDFDFNPAKKCANELIWLKSAHHIFSRILDFHKIINYYLAHVIEQPNFRIPNPEYFVYLFYQTVGQDTLQFIFWNHATFSNSF